MRVIRSSFVTERSFLASPPVVDNRKANRVRPRHTLRRNNIVINGFLGGQNEDELLATLSVLCDNTMEYMSERTKMLYTYSPSVVRGETRASAELSSRRSEPHRRSRTKLEMSRCLEVGQRSWMDRYPRKGFRTPNGWTQDAAASASASAVGWAVQPLPPPHPNPIQLQHSRGEKRQRRCCSSHSERGRLAVALGCGGRGRVHTVVPPSLFQIISPFFQRCNQCGFGEFKLTIN